MISVSVLFLGPSKDFAKTESASYELPDGATVSDLRGVLVEHVPGLIGAMATIRFAVNEEFARDETVLSSGDEVALIPPVSGGSSHDGVMVDLVREPIAAELVRDFVTGDTTLGGITTFEGVTRGEDDGQHGRLSRLEYEAYESMARQQLDRLANEAMNRWSAGRVAIVHRLGSVEPGEASVVIAVACGHRAESFDACRWLIDTLKKDVPIWKKDVFADGFVRWVDPNAKA